jgi:hypothetical protein
LLLLLLLLLLLFLETRVRAVTGICTAGIASG